MDEHDRAGDLERVRGAVAAQSWTLERVVREIELVDMHERAIRDMCRAAKEEVVPGLLAAMRTRDGVAKQNACIMLLQLGDDRGTQGDRRVPLLADPASHIGGLSLDLVIRFATPDAARLVPPLLDHPAPSVRKKAIRWYAERGDPKALETIATMLIEEDDRSEDYWLLQSLEVYAEHTAAGVRARAAEVAAAFVRSVLDDDDNTTANHVWTALRALEMAAPDWESSLLEAVLSSKILAWVRAVALTRLASIEGERGEARLCEALEIADLRAEAAEALASRRCDGVRLRGPLVHALERELEEGEPGGRALSAIVNALLAHGLGAEPILDRAASALPPWDRTRIVGFGKEFGRARWPNGFGARASCRRSTRRRSPWSRSSGTRSRAPSASCSLSSARNARSCPRDGRPQRAFLCAPHGLSDVLPHLRRRSRAPERRHVASSSPRRGRGRRRAVRRCLRGSGHRVARSGEARQKLTLNARPSRQALPVAPSRRGRCGRTPRRWSRSCSPPSALPSTSADLR